LLSKFEKSFNRLKMAAAVYHSAAARDVMSAAEKLTRELGFPARKRHLNWRTEYPTFHTSTPNSGYDSFECTEDFDGVSLASRTDSSCSSVSSSGSESSACSSAASSSSVRTQVQPAKRAKLASVPVSPVLTADSVREHSKEEEEEEDEDELDMAFASADVSDAYDRTLDDDGNARKVTPGIRQVEKLMVELWHERCDPNKRFTLGLPWKDAVRNMREVHSMNLRAQEEEEGEEERSVVQEKGSIFQFMKAIAKPTRRRTSLNFSFDRIQTGRTCFTL